MKQVHINVLIRLTVVLLICSLGFNLLFFSHREKKIKLPEFVKQVIFRYKKYDNIFRAIDDGNLYAVKKHIKKDPRYLHGSILHYAVMENKNDIVKYLISKKVDINFVAHCRPGLFQNEQETTLQFAIRTGKKRAAKMLIKAGANLNTENKYGATPLFLAVDQGWYDVVKMLIEGGAGNEIRENQGIMLHAAARKGSLELVKLLVDNGADVNATYNNKYQRNTTPLFFSVESSNFPVTRYLMEKGARINIKNDYGETPLHIASEVGNIQMVKLLLKNGADLNAKTFRGKSALDRSITFKRKELSRFLIEKGIDINPVTLVNYCHSPVETAIYYNDEDILVLLLKRGAAPNTHDIMGTNSLFTAVRNNNLKIVQLLLKTGSDPNVKTIDGEGVLNDYPDTTKPEIIEELINYGYDVNTKVNYRYDFGTKPEDNAEHLIFYMLKHPHLVKVMVEKGAKINVENKSKRTPLFIAMGEGYGKTVEILEKAGANKNPIDEYGKTPLHYAADKCNGKAVSYLIKKGFDVNAKDKRGATPLHYAKFAYGLNIHNYSEEQKDAIRFLLSAGAVDKSLRERKTKKSVKTELSRQKEHIRERIDYFISYNKLNLLKQIIKEHPWVINYKDNKGETPIFSACCLDSAQIARCLVDKGADINIRNKKGEPPIFNTCRNSSIENIKYLLDSGADINARNNNDETPLFSACYNSNTKTIKYLIKKGADVNPRLNNSWGSPLNYAICHWQPENAIVLIKSGANLNTRDKEGNSPFHNSLKYTNYPYRYNYNFDENLYNLQNLLILKTPNLNIVNNNGETPLHIAICESLQDVSTALIKNKVNLNVQDNEGRTPLHIAVSKGACYLAKDLVNNHAKVNLQDKNGNTPLHEAAYRGDIYTVKLLVESGAKVNIPNNKGETPLHCLVNRDYREWKRIGDYEYQWRHDTRNKVFTGYEETARYLIKKGAKVKAKDSSGNTPLHYAKKYGYMKTAKILEQ